MVGAPAASPLCGRSLVRIRRLTPLRCRWKGWAGRGRGCVRWASRSWSARLLNLGGAGGLPPAGPLQSDIQALVLVKWQASKFRDSCNMFSAVHNTLPINVGGYARTERTSKTHVNVTGERLLNRRVSGSQGERTVLGKQGCGDASPCSQLVSGHSISMWASHY